MKTIDKIEIEIKKFILRIFNKDKYYSYKNYLKLENKKSQLDPKLIEELKKYNELIKTKKELNFKHSGHLGDLIYALPVIKEIAKKNKCNLYVNLNKKFKGYHHKHPAGKVMITEKIYEMVYPLLNYQDYINKVDIYDGESIDIDLDLFRKLPISLQFNSCRWYFHITGVQTDLSKPFIDVPEHPNLKNKVVIIKTPRAKNPFLDYSFIKKYNGVIFLGTKQEYLGIKKYIPNIEFYDTKNFFELAQIIKSCRFYVSNQTFGYALAEGLKVKRLLEANPEFPVIFPIGGEGKDVYFQHNFEKVFEEYYNS